MKGSVRSKFQTKAKRLMQIYSLWHETHEARLEHQYLRLLGEILQLEPGFSLKQEFQKAF